MIPTKKGKMITIAVLDTLEERKRQDKKWGEQNHNPFIYLGILMEEVGELAQAILETQFGGSHGGWDKVRTEAIHCAAVSIAIIECLDRNTWRQDDIHFLYKRPE
jgi:NTP pyrophosphatase (non-canonical NTP hydrolase)